MVIGRGLTIGRPLHSSSPSSGPGADCGRDRGSHGHFGSRSVCTEGDVVVAAAGSPGLVTPGMVKPGAAVVAAGTTFEGRKVLSDVDERVAEVAGWLSPRLGGVGPMTRAMLLQNAVAAAETAAKSS